MQPQWSLVLFVLFLIAYNRVESAGCDCRYSNETQSNAQNRMIKMPLDGWYKWGEKMGLDTLRRYWDLINQLLEGDADVMLKNVQDLYYVGPIFLGNPKQIFSMSFDTGSSDLVAPSAKICDCPPNDTYCSSHNTYNRNESATYKKCGRAFSITYGSGYVSGYVARDTLRVGDLRVENQVFGLACNISEEFIVNKFDGLFGLAFPDASQTKGRPPFFKMMDQDLLEKPVFAFYFSKDGASGSELVFGGVDPDRYTGNFTYTRVTRKFFWQITVCSLSVGRTIVGRNLSAIVDTGTSLIVGPGKYIDPINRKIFGDPDESGLYTIESNGTTVCFSGFMSMNSGDLTVLGNVFLRKYYTVFDAGKSRVGFAESK